MKYVIFHVDIYGGDLNNPSFILHRVVRKTLDRVPMYRKLHQPTTRVQTLGGKQSALKKTLRHEENTQKLHIQGRGSNQLSKVWG